MGSCFWTGVRLSSPPPKEEASNSSSSRMSSRLCIDLGMPFRASPFRFPDVVFCVLRRFKPEEALVYPSGLFCALKRLLGHSEEDVGAQPAISLRSMRFMDWVRGKDDVFKRLLFHFVPKKLEQTFPAFSRCSSPI